MKKPLLAILAVLIVAACAATAADFTQDEARSYVDLSAEQDTIQDALGATDLPLEQRRQLEARSDALQERMDGIEEQVEARKNEGVLGAIAGALGPLGEVLTPLLAFAPLLGPRGRKHGANLIRSVTPGTGRPAKNLAADLAKYVGAVHTEPPVTATGSSSAP